MALWGNKDDIFSPGSVTVNYENLTITGSGTSFLAASVGDVISIGVGKTFGEAVISGITSERLLSIATTDYLSGAPIAAVANYTISQKPKFTMGDSHFSADEIYGVSEDEVAITKTFLTHAGWVGVTTYLDNEGELRTKSEVLVAMSGITTGVTSYASAGDAADDVTLPDAVITILSQPSSVGIATTTLPEDAEFTVVASVVPAGTNLTYQWQEDSGSGFTNLVGETDSTLIFENTDDTNDGNEYRVVISVAGGDNTVTSGIATLSIN
jgi:hypothetical protein